MPGPEPIVLLAYGPAPGMELIPYFLALLAWAGMALAAIFLRPLTALYRYLRGIKPAPPMVNQTEATAAAAPEASCERREQDLPR